MARLRYNGLSTTLGAALTSADTTITFTAALTSMSGTVPTIAGSDYIPLVIGSEIVNLTAYTSGATTGTIARAQESTTAAAHASGATVENAPTVADFSTGSAGRVLLKQLTLGADTASLAFTSTDIPTSGYNHLQVVVVSRSTAAASGDGINIALNGDTTTANYKYQVFQGASGSVAAVTAAARTIGYTDAASDPANAAGVTVIDIPDYLGSWHKIVQSASSKAGDPVVAKFMVRWANVAAITAVTLTCGANFKAGSKAWLYGLA